MAIVDQLGRMVWSQQVVGKQQVLQPDLSNSKFSSGVYFIKLSFAGETITARLEVLK